MKEIIYKISKNMYLTLLTPKHQGGAGLNSDKEVFEYLNTISGFKGVIKQLQID